MGTDKPLISILMAVYEPRMDWLREQLLSLEAQTYPNLKLYIRDDCSPTVPFDEIRSCVQECIHSFPYELRRNEKNLGSNGTFELLTQESEGEYFAYCDQDDVWLPEKLTVLQEEIERSGAQLVCSDMYVIDGTGKQTADSITKVRRHHVFYSGEGLAKGLLFHNFVTGCTMLVRAEQAKAAVPFCPHMVHDHYIALWCAACGSILSLQERLIRYRIHGGNQTEIMAGVHDKESYRKVRIDLVVNKLEWLKENFPASEELTGEIDRGLVWAKARQSRFQGNAATAKTIWKYREFGLPAALFELVAAVFPERLFMTVIKLCRKNVL